MFSLPTSVSLIFQSNSNQDYDMDTNQSEEK